MMIDIAGEADNTSYYKHLIDRWSAHNLNTAIAAEVQRAVTQTKLTLWQSHYHSTNPKPKAKL